MRFRNYTAQHGAWLLAVALFVTVTAICVRRMDGPRAEKALKFFTWALPAVYLSRFTVFLLLDIFVEPQMPLLDRLPFHLCTVNAIIMPIGVMSKNKTLLNYMYAISMPGACMAMLTPAMSYYGQYYSLSWQVVFFYLDHAIMTLVPILCVASGTLRPDRRRLPYVAAIIFPYAGAIYFANKLLNQNWLFLNYPDEGTVLSFFAGFMGNPGYLASILALAFIIVTLLYLPWKRADNR